MPCCYCFGETSTKSDILHDPVEKHGSKLYRSRPIRRLYIMVLSFFSHRGCFFSSGLAIQQFIVGGVVLANLILSLCLEKTL
jgi:hypothetical protein